MQIDLLVTVLSLTMSRALGIPLGQAFNDVTTFWNIVVSLGWIVVLVYVVWKVLDRLKKLDEKQTRILERLEKILEHLGTEHEQRDDRSSA